MQELLDKLQQFPKLQKRIELEWGTLALKNFLELLLSDTRGNTRQGFPTEVAEALLLLSIRNTEILEDHGVEFPDFESSMFSDTGWHIPKNF